MDVSRTTYKTCPPIILGILSKYVPTLNRINSSELLGEVPSDVILNFEWTHIHIVVLDHSAVHDEKLIEVPVQLIPIGVGLQVLEERVGRVPVHFKLSQG